MNISKRITVYFIVIIFILMMVTTLSACEKKNPNVELKVYDENWVELEKENRGYKNSYEFLYDGEPKGFNAELFLNGDVLIRYDFTNSRNYNETGLRVAHYEYKKNDNGDYQFIHPPIVERGDYKIEIGINIDVSYTRLFISENGKEKITRGELTQIGFSIVTRTLSFYIKVK